MADCLRRFAASKCMDDGVERNPRAGNVVLTFSPFDVLRCHALLLYRRVITHTQIRKLLYTDARFRDFLMELFKGATVLFVGYSFRNPHVDSVLQEIMSTTDGNTPPHTMHSSKIQGRSGASIWRKTTTWTLSLTW